MQLLNSIFLPMLAGHLIADFWLQPSEWVKHKKENGWKSGRLFLHSVVAAVLPVLFVFNLSLWWFIPVIFIMHFFTDLLKSKLKENIFSFIADQAVHILVLIILVKTNSEITLSGTDKNIWLYGIGFILVTTPVGILTGLMLSRFIKSKTNEVIVDVSAWIGIFERILILIFLLVGQYSALGFLITAKSIFRFNEAKEGGNKKAEYFLLGTLISFTFAIGIGLILARLTLT